MKPSPLCHQLALLTVCSLGLATALSAQPLDLPNAGFEAVDAKTGLPAGWTSWANPATAAYTLATARTGVAAARITDASPTVSQGLRSPRVPIVPGHVYEAGVWVKIAHAQAGGFAVYLEFWAGTRRVQDTSAATSQASDWVWVKSTATAPAGATEATVLIYGSSATVGEAYFDDAALTALP